MKKQITSENVKDFIGSRQDTYLAKAVKGIDAQARTIRAYASTSAWDRYGERFAPDAFMAGLDNFKKNPVILFAHDYQAEPIAKAVAFEFDDKGLILTMKFANTPKAEQIFALYEGGFMSAFSVGFRPLEVAFEERVKGTGEMGAVFVRAELLENSAVPVPANPEAVVIRGFSGKTTKIAWEVLSKFMSGDYEIKDAVVPGPSAEPEPAVVAPEPAAPAAAVEEPAKPAEAAPEAPKSLKEAVGYLISLGKVAREKGKIEDEAVRSLLIQAVNLCRELVLGKGAQSLDGMDGDDLSDSDAALIKELEVLTDELVASGRGTQKDYAELQELSKFIEENILKKVTI